MSRRTTVELDDDLLARAQRALGCTTMRATIEEALRRATTQANAEAAERQQRQRGYLERLESHVDPLVLSSDEMWR
ncbi:type II toxin-antitoxin system VapB family antitoxin [soil metagenome]